MNTKPVKPLSEARDADARKLAAQTHTPLVIVNNRSRAENKPSVNPEKL